MLNVITWANMPANENVSGGSHKASTNVSPQALRLRTSVSIRLNSPSAFSSRAISAAGVPCAGDSASRFGNAPPVKAAVQTSFV